MIVLVSVVRDEVSFSGPEFHTREAALLANRSAQPDDDAEVVRQEAPGLFRKWRRPETGVIEAIIEVRASPYRAQPARSPHVTVIRHPAPPQRRRRGRP